MADLQLSGVAPVGGARSNAAPAPAASPPATPDSATGAPATPSSLPVATTTASPVPGSAAAVAAATVKPPSTPSADEQVKQAAKAAVKDANAAMAASNTLLVFVFDDQTHHMTVKVLDVQTQKVVQEIPLQHMPAMASALAGDSPSGNLVDTKA